MKRMVVLAIVMVFIVSSTAPRAYAGGGHHHGGGSSWIPWAVIGGVLGLATIGSVLGTGEREKTNRLKIASDERLGHHGLAVQQNLAGPASLDGSGETCSSGTWGNDCVEVKTARDGNYGTSRPRLERPSPRVEKTIFYPPAKKQLPRKRLYVVYSEKPSSTRGERTLRPNMPRRGESSPPAMTEKVVEWLQEVKGDGGYELTLDEHLALTALIVALEEPGRYTPETYRRYAGIASNLPSRIRRLGGPEWHAGAVEAGVAAADHLARRRA